MTVYEMQGLLLDADGKPCDTNTAYQSVILDASAALLDDCNAKRDVLREIVSKYTPHLVQNDMPDNMIRGTAVIKITIDKMTGKNYD